MASSAPKRGPTAYFLFADSVREAVKAELQAKADSGTGASGKEADPAAPAGAKKVSVALVAKGIGERWKALTDEEKARFKAAATTRAAAAAAAAAEAAEAAGPGESAPGAAADDPAASAPAPPLPGSSLPLSVVRRLMLVDPDVKRVSAGAARAVAAAVEAAVAALARSSAAVAAASKRRTLRPADILGAVRADGRWADTGCVGVLTAGGGGAGAAVPAPSPGAAAKTKKVAGKRPAPAEAADAAAFFKPRPRVG